ncbi:MAG: hypothetical protein WBF37_11515 [Dehalococcoidia bacterium]
MTSKQIGVVCSAIVLAVAAPLLVLVMLRGLDSWVSAQPTSQYPTFSIEDGGPSTPSGGGLLDPADILQYNPGGAPLVCIPCANLGLSGCAGSPDVPPYDDLDALTYGADFGAYSSATGYLGFSVDTGSSGQAGTAVNVESGCQPAEPEADEFTTQLDGNNFQFFDGDGTACGANAGAPLGLVEPGGPPDGDDLDAIDNKDCSEIDYQPGDGVPDREVYFSLTPGSPTLPTIPGATPSGADILVTIGGGAPSVYALAAQLGLVQGDDVNGLCLAETVWPPGHSDRLFFDPDGSLTGSPDYLFYTVEKSSPSIPAVVPDAATIMYVPAPGVAVPVDLATALGLLDDNTDDVDAMKCVKGLVDISIEEFTITLPDESTAPPETEVTLSICEWSDFLMFEEKLYTGINEELSPGSVTSQVGWAVLGYYPGQLNVRFNAHAGDICTDDTGAPVPCGEGGIVGVPWAPQNLPFPPPAGVDTCKDDIDNDNDGPTGGGCDIDGCPLFPDPDPDCVDIYDVHFEIDLDWDTSKSVDREVQLHCKEGTDGDSFDITFQNIELPLGADDIDIDGTENNVGLIDLTIICEEASTVEACCYPDGSCANEDPQTCGGTPQGPGTVCTAPEACCFGDGTCALLDPLCCADQGGTALGQGSQCLGIEGCCSGAGACTDADAACCSYLGDTPQGPGSACTVSQACCINGGASCTDCDVLCCDDEGGTPGGPMCLGDTNPANGIDDACEAIPDEIKWVQTPDESEFGLDVSAYEPFVLADDFPCTESGLITKIDFWASWYHDEPPEMNPNNVAFILSLHSDVPAGVDQDWSHPGETLWMHHFAAGDCTVQDWAGVPLEGWLEPPEIYIPDADHMIWLYSCPIPDPLDSFQQVEDTIYWLDIQAFPGGPGQFGWKTSPVHWNDDGVWATGAEPEIPPLSWSELRYPFGPPPHPLAGQSIDLAFRLWGHECPAGVDTDFDGFDDDVECYVGTDRLDDCPDVIGADDAWPLDINMDKKLSILKDVLKYRGNIGKTVAAYPDVRRLDLNADGKLSILKDVLKYRGHIGDTCT